MNKDKKIEFLTNENKSLHEQIDSLTNENKMLYGQIAIYQESNHESSKDVGNVLADLYKKMDEYASLILKCKELEEKYSQLISDATQLMRDYRKDMGEIRKKKIFSGNKE